MSNDWSFSLCPNICCEQSVSSLHKLFKDHEGYVLCVKLFQTPNISTLTNITSPASSSSSSGLMLSAYARVGAVLQDGALLERALKVGTFLKEHMWDGESRTVIRSCYRGDQMEVQHM